LIATNTIVHYSLAELEQAITRELDENPALELVERAVCPQCARSLDSGICPSCIADDQRAEPPQSPRDEAAWEFFGSVPEEEGDPLWAVAAPLTLSERLLRQLQLLLDASEHEIALQVVGNIDEHGFFVCSVEELAHQLQIEPMRVQHVLEELQSLDPPGIGARNVAECLLIQLRQLELQGSAAPPAAKSIIQEHFEALGRHQFERIRHALALSREEVERTFLYIRTNLHPYPAHHYYAHSSEPPSVSPRVVPSVVIQRNTTAPSGYTVEVVESQRFLLRVSPLYRQLHHEPKLMLTPGEREHVTHYFERARLFITGLQRRALLLQKVTTQAITHQREFLEYCPLYLRPLTQHTIAQELGVHASLISRVVAGKFAQLPSCELLPLSRFFAAEMRIQELIRQMILQEHHPLSDARIAQRLRDQYGVSLSRQMVANYRADLGIQAARQRAVVGKTRRSE
jgi:RNA polymerase sigma-54 factor